MGKVGAGMKPREPKSELVSEKEGHSGQANEPEIATSEGVDGGYTPTVEKNEVSGTEETGANGEISEEKEISVAESANPETDLDALIGQSKPSPEPDYKGQLTVTVTIPEGLEDAIREAAEIDDEGVDGWVQKRFIEYLEAFYTPAQSR